MGKYKYLAKNVGVLTISNFGTKVLSFILIPLYTSILSTADYGTYDIYTTTVSLITPLLTANIIEAVMRFALDESDKSAVLSIGLKRIFWATCVFTGIVLANYFIGAAPIFNRFPQYLLLYFLSAILYDILSQFSRGIEKITLVAVAGAINSFTMLSLNVLFLVNLKMGLEGYFLANILSYIVPNIVFIFHLRVWRYIKTEPDQILKDRMFSYSRPLVFNTIAWWINNVSDRYIVTWLSGVAANGVYSVAYKIPSVLNIFQSIFSQAWTLSAVKEFNKDSGKFYTNIYKIYNSGMVIVCSMLILFDRVMARILFAKDFFEAWRYAPFLMISVVFGSLSGMLGGIFSAAKRSDVFAKTTMVGASVNTALNILLVYLWGPIGAAVATLISYMIVWEERLKRAKELTDLEIDLKRDIAMYIVIIAQAIIWVVGLPILAAYIVEGVLAIIVICLNRKDLMRICDVVWRKVRHE